MAWAVVGWRIGMFIVSRQAGRPMVGQRAYGGFGRQLYGCPMAVLWLFYVWLSLRQCHRVFARGKSGRVRGKS